MIKNVSIICSLVFLNFLIVYSQDTQDPFYDPKKIQTPQAPEFIVYENDMPCVLVRLNASLTIEPKRTANKKIRVDIPRSATASGSCGYGDDSKIILKWSSFLFTMHFQKSRVSDAWYVDVIEVVYNTSDKAFANDLEGVGVASTVQVMRTEDPLTLFLTPIGRSFSCAVGREIKMYDDKKFSRITISFSRVEIQPFGIMTQRQYGDPFYCAEQTGGRDETVPLAVGSMLALVVLLTIAGYSGYVYFKVKKVEYDTME